MTYACPIMPIPAALLQFTFEAQGKLKARLTYMNATVRPFTKPTPVISRRGDAFRTTSNSRMYCSEWSATRPACLEVSPMRQSHVRGSLNDFLGNTAIPRMEGWRMISTSSM